MPCRTWLRADCGFSSSPGFGGLPLPVILSTMYTGTVAAALTSCSGTTADRRQVSQATAFTSLSDNLKNAAGDLVHDVHRHRGGGAPVT